MYRLQNTKFLVTLFIVLTLILIVVFAFLYGKELSYALNMDPHSYECIYDNMMKQLCHRPYTASISWDVLGLAAYCWPVIIVWLIIGIILIVKLRKHRNKNSNSNA
jgi:disulfide bond formation protein DsbB